mmetsp:Transcript_107483/g.302489  ORF Transcript_107483/g.302489 Transcript_107483/m.302489 type:complete len:581 (-) Transcript_107483:187-1929(-)
MTSLLLSTGSTENLNAMPATKNLIVMAISFAVFCGLVVLLVHLGLFGYFGLFVYFAIPLTTGVCMTWLYLPPAWLNRAPRIQEMLLGSLNWYASRKQEFLAHPFRHHVVTWMLPAFINGYCLFTAMWLLHIATYYYVLYMMRIEDEMGPSAALPRSQAGLFSGPYGALSPGLSERNVSFGSIVDVPESFSAWEDVKIKQLDMIAAALPLLFAMGAVYTADVTIWTKAMLCNAFLALVKGLIGAMTIVPDSSGWENCKARLGDKNIDFFKHGLPNPWYDGPLTTMLEIIRMEIDGPRHDRVMSGVRWCADMMYSGHTYFTCLYALALLELLQRQIVSNRLSKPIYYFMALLIAFEQFMEIKLVLSNRFHYSSDIFVAIVITMLWYTNGPTVIAAKWWASFGRPDAKHEGHIWVPPFCLPFCCFGGMDGYHALTWIRGDHALEEDLLSCIFGQDVKLTQASPYKPTWTSGVVVGLDLGEQNHERYAFQSYTPTALEQPLQPEAAEEKYIQVAWLHKDGKRVRSHWYHSTEVTVDSNSPLDVESVERIGRLLTDGLGYGNEMSLDLQHIIGKRLLRKAQNAGV